MRDVTRQTEAMAKNAAAFFPYSWYRFSDDRCLRMAASLSYTSLLAVVPLTAIAFSMLAAFPVFEGVRGDFQAALFSNFLPQSADAMREYFDQFVANTAKLTAVGIIGLAVTAILLLGTIEADLNVIFRVPRPRALIPRLLVFWAVLTLGPLLLGASFSLSTYFFALTQWAGLDQGTGPLERLTRLLPTVISLITLTLFYMIIPNRPVALRAAVVGGTIAGLMLGLLRVRPGTLCRITEFSEHESNGRELDEGERVAVEVLPVLGQSAAAVEPGDGAFDHPTPGLDDEALHPIGSLDDLGLEIGQDAGQGAVKDRALIGAVGEQFPEKGKQTEQGRQQRETAVAILNVGGGDDAVQQQALRIDQNMPLLALDQLAGIEAVAVDASPPFSALFTL